MLPSAAPVASAPWMKLRREASAGWVVAAVLLLLFGAGDIHVGLAPVVGGIGTAAMTNCKSETTLPRRLQR